MHVHANAATSVDGKLATRLRRQVALSGPADFERVDGLRASVDAVLVGVGTVLADDPHLTSDNRDDGGPARVVLDSMGRTPTDARVLDGRATSHVLVAAHCPADRIEALETAGANVIVTEGQRRADVDTGLDALESAGIERLLVEGGGEVLYSVFAAGRVDELTVFVSPHVVGGREAPTLVDGLGFTETFPRLSLEAADRVDDGLLCTYAVDGWAPSPAAGQSSD
ncbi:MAG: 2,5-diamino-6-(ribosylamino)-4(3H)-pyrimidinone 5'-phosphate reductase [Halobacteriales archaeon]